MQYKENAETLMAVYIYIYIYRYIYKQAEYAYLTERVIPYIQQKNCLCKKYFLQIKQRSTVPIRNQIAK